MSRDYKNALLSNTIKAFKSVLIFAVTVYILASCTPTKTSYFFKTLQKDTTLSGLVNKDLESKIMKGDVLAINFSSLNKEEDQLYNSGISMNNTSTGIGFPVNQEGTIYIHKLGVVKAEGSTRKELAAILQKSLTPFLKDPIVTVQYLNHKVTVMGEVERPQIINMSEEQISIIDAIVISGDVKANAKKDHIMVIREVGNQKKVKILNLEDHSIFSSSWYYLQPNDIVYVVPDEEKRIRDEKRTRFQTNFAIVSASVSLLVILLSRIFP